MTLKHLITRFNTLNLIIIIAIIILFSSCSDKSDSSAENDITLDSLWKFKASDSLIYADTKFNDSDWLSVNVGTPWEDFGFKDHDGYAWYRYHVVIPSSMKGDGKNHFLQIFLGKIDDNDQVFLNGKLIGENNTLVPKGAKATKEFSKQPALYEIDRLYEIDINDNSINWNGPNVIAVRVFDQRNGGGMVFKAPYISGSPINFVSNRSVVLDGKWKFHPGDSLQYNAPDYNDRNWKDLNISSEWEAQGNADYDGFAWYRKKVTIPAVLKKDLSPTVAFLRFHLGKIDDNDQVFLNGHLLGENNRLLSKNEEISKKFSTENPMFGVDRNYDLQVSDDRIIWNGENTIAIRVFDQRNGGGMTAGRPVIKMQTIGDFINLDKGAFYREIENANGNVDSLLYINNTHSRLSFNGRAKIQAFNTKTAERIFSRDEAILVRPGGALAIPVPLPKSNEEVLVTVQLLINDTVYFKDRIVLPYVM